MPTHAGLQRPNLAVTTSRQNVRSFIPEQLFLPEKQPGRLLRIIEKKFKNLLTVRILSGQMRQQKCITL